MILLTQVGEMAFGRMKYTLFPMTRGKKKMIGTSIDRL